MDKRGRSRGGKSCNYPLLFILSVGQSEVRGWSDWRGHKVVLSKKKFNMESPCISFYSFFRLSFAGSVPLSKKKLTGVPLEKASSDIVRQPPPQKKGKSIKNIRILTSPPTKKSGTVVETLPPSNLKRDWSKKWHFCILIKK